MKAKRVSEVLSTGHCRSTSCEQERGVRGSLGVVPGHVGVWGFEEHRLLEDRGSPEILLISCTWHNLETLIFGSPLEGVEFFSHLPP